MKLLSWMHRKLQKDNTGSVTGSAVGNSCLSLKQPFNNHDDYIRQGNNSTLQCRHYLDGFQAEDTINVNKEESDDIFPGFLTIGTLSVEPVTEPPTPTFDLPCQAENEEGTAEMKYDLKLITEELEKFLSTEAGKEENNEPSDRSSEARDDVSLIDKENEVDNYVCIDMKEYPLQGYLLASSGELREIKQKEKKERAFLQELFRKSILTDKRSSDDAEKNKKKAAKKLKSSTRIMNKMLQAPWGSPKNSTASKGCAAKSFPTMKKPSKIKQLFHKKIHPDISTAEKDPNKLSKNETDEILDIPNCNHATTALDLEATRMGCWGALIKGENQSKTHMKLARHASTKKKVNTAANDKNSSASEEHWINTDADYLVLELQQNREVPR